MGFDTSFERSHPPNTDSRICLNCGHEERFSDNEGGTCEKIVDEESKFCGCVCKFGAIPRCPTCGEEATYQTPDSTYWCAIAHYWRAG